MCSLPGPPPGSMPRVSLIGDGLRSWKPRPKCTLVRSRRRSAPESTAAKVRALEGRSRSYAQRLEFSRRSERASSGELAQSLISGSQHWTRRLCQSFLARAVVVLCVAETRVPAETRFLRRAGNIVGHDGRA